MRALVFESCVGGHKAHYVSVLVGELLRIGVEVHLTLPKGWQKWEEAQVYLSEIASMCVTSTVTPENGSPRKIAVSRLNSLAQVASKCRPDHVYVPFADGLVQAWGAQIFPRPILPNVCAEGLLMRGNFAYPSRSALRSMINRLNRCFTNRSGFDRLHFLDPLVHASLNGRAAVTGTKIPEAITPLSSMEVTKARRILHCSTTTKLITCPGGITERKGIDLLIKAFAELERDSDTTLYLLGKHSPGIRSLLESTSIRNLVNDGRLVSQDRFATKDEFDALFLAADLVCTPYPRHNGSSSIIVRTAHAGRPLLSTDWGWCGWATETFDLGKTVNVLDQSAFVDALKTCLRNGAAQGTNSPMRNAFLRFHTLENHLAVWTERIRERMGLPPQSIVTLPMERATVHPPEALHA